MGGQVAHELDGVAARVGQLLDARRAPRAASWAISASVVREDQLGVGDVEHLEHVLERDLLAAVGDELVERADRVAEAARGRAGDHRERAVVGLDPLGVRDPRSGRW